MQFFIHIPKAAGTSLRSALQQAVGPRLVPAYPGHDKWDLDRVLLRAPLLPKDAVLFGHFRWGIHARLGQPARYATVLRHPVDRIVSWYNWMGSHEHLPLHRQARSGVPLAQMIQSGAAGELSNVMVEYVAGVPARGLADADTLKIAKARLRTFEFVSVAEVLYLDLPRLSKSLGVAVSSVPRENKSIFRSQIDEATRDVILRYNALDLELYEFAWRIATSKNSQLQVYSPSGPNVSSPAHDRQGRRSKPAYPA